MTALWTFTVQLEPMNQLMCEVMFFNHKQMDYQETQYNPTCIMHPD